LIAQVFVTPARGEIGFGLPDEFAVIAVRPCAGREKVIAAG